MKGGTELLVESLAGELRNRGHDVDVVGLPFRWNPKKEVLKNCMAWRLLDLEHFEGKRVDLLIATKFPSYLARHPNKVTYLFHQFRQVYDTFGTEYSGYRNFGEDRKLRDIIVGADNRFLPESRKIFTISRNVSERLKKFNNIESTHLYPPPRSRDRFHHREYGDYLLYVGRLNRTKRVDLLIRAMSHVKGEFRCVIAGTGEEKADLVKLAKKLKVESRVEFHGYVSDENLLELYSGCFAVFYAPYDEDYGFAPVEAFLSRKPVVTTSDAGGVLEFVADGTTGLVAPVDPQAMAVQVDRLFSDKDLCARLGGNGHERVDHIHWDSVIGSLVA